MGILMLLNLELCFGISQAWRRVVGGLVRVGMKSLLCQLKDLSTVVLGLAVEKKLNKGI